jgi:hypothetical protein
MRISKRIVLCLVCVLVFLLTATTSCVLRAKYGYIPRLKATYAYMYVANIEMYSFLQYNQAGPEQGREALLQYLKLLQRIRDEKIEFPQSTLHRDFGLTYLRLYRLESAASNSSVAEDYMKSAKREWSALGWKPEDVSTEALGRLIETREINERKLYNGSGIDTSAPQADRAGSKESFK